MAQLFTGRVKANTRARDIRVVTLKTIFFMVILFSEKNNGRPTEPSAPAENLLLGTWYMDSYFGIKNPYAYLIAMSIVDGFYPIISRWVINWLSKKSTFGVYAPQLT